MSWEGNIQSAIMIFRCWKSAIPITNTQLYSFVFEYEFKYKF